MSLEFPRPQVASLQQLGTRLVDSRKVGAPLESIARDLYSGFYELCMRSGLDRLLHELGIEDSSGLTEHETLFPALVTQLQAIDLDGGGPRNAKPRQLADCVVAALGLTLVDDTAPAIELGGDVKTEVAAALTGVVNAQLGVPQVREAIVAMARERCDERYHPFYNKVVAQLDERGTKLLKTPKVPIDSLQAIQRALFDARIALFDRVGRAAIDRAKDVIAKASPEAAARIDQPITHELTPREVAILRLSDPRVSKMPAAITETLLDSLTELLRLSWRQAEKPVRKYAASQTFSVGELVEHPKFGRGSVVSAHTQRIEVEFADGKYTLVHVGVSK
jgi:hypothetical protein